MATDTEFGEVDLAKMTSLIGHEIRNPLAVISNSIYYIKNKVEAAQSKDEKVAKHIRIIESEVQRANSILKEVSLFFKLKELATKAAALDGFMEELLAAHAFPDGIAVKKSLQSKATVSIDPAQLQRAVEAVLQNAVDALPSGGTVTVGAKTEKGQAVVEIADSGPGFTPEATVKAFTPFFTTKERRMGLGLATVRRIMTLHQGKAEVRKSSAGAVVRLTLTPA
ncbi:MAG: HAMP domain-containing histidine kinase [Elusimicrobia bacterium]|nr:HAMP domain-containing histidine kinase [Elusimicrobiota bacterium]